jgi:molybdate transport system substrate-binding protein
VSALQLLCAGAAHGVVAALAPRFEADAGVRIDSRFGPVGMLREALLAGASCDVFVATRAIVDALVAAGRLDGATRADLGRVPTGLAVRTRDPALRIDDSDALRAALLAADRVYLPDPRRATAGIHFVSVLQRLGVHETLASRLSTHESGAASMRALAAATDAAPLGCTQLSEILDTEGVRVVGPLPPGCELVTTYTAAVALGTADAVLARRFLQRISGSAALRRSRGFELD